MNLKIRVHQGRFGAGETLISLGLRSTPPAVEFVVRIRLAITRQS